jgi:DNA invertase Pin-like site-specific DNA recombinase
MSPHYGKFVAYFRVSTDRQGKSGLGLDAQRQAVMSYLDGGRWTLVAEFTEVESGKRDDNRPQLAAAIAACKRQKARLVIAKLDRLSRNLAFIAALDGERCGVRGGGQSGHEQAHDPYPGGRCRA